MPLGWLWSRTKQQAPKPYDNADLTIREMRHNDKYELFSIVADFRKTYYINIYKSVFRSWFTYVTTGLLLGLSLSLLSSSMVTVCLPPLIVTLFLLWKVNRYKRMNHLPNVNDLELLNQVESFNYKFKSVDSRRMNQGVLLMLAKVERKSLATGGGGDSDEIVLDSDLESDYEDLSPETSRSKKFKKKMSSQALSGPDKGKRIVGYLVYSKQRDELETVCVKELCIHSDFRQRKIATNFLKRACLNVFQVYGYRHVCFQVSNYHQEAMRICAKKPSLIKKIYSWVAYVFIPGVSDERTVYSINIGSIK